MLSTRKRFAAAFLCSAVSSALVFGCTPEEPKTPKPKKPVAAPVASVPDPTPTAAPQTTPLPPIATKPARIHVHYREAANIFEVLDNTTLWLEGKCDPEYRAYWDEKVGKDAEDTKAFGEYKTIRAKHYENVTAGPQDLFGPVKPADKFANAFYESDTIAQALEKLTAASVVNSDELAVLKRFYDRLTPKLTTIVSESQIFSQHAKNLDARLARPSSTAFVDELAGFYGVPPTNISFDVLYIWWPPVDHTSANNRGRTLLMKYNPQKNSEDLDRGDPEIAVHELAHWLSSQQPDDRKQALSKTFMTGCEITNVQQVNILEEPLAVAHQKLFLATTEPDRFEMTSTWYGDPWVSIFAKLIYGHVEDAYDKTRVIDETFMRRTARLCTELKKVGQKINTPGDPKKPAAKPTTPTAKPTTTPAPAPAPAPTTAPKK